MKLGLGEITCFSVEYHSNNIILGHTQDSNQTEDIQYLLSLYKIEQNEFTLIQKFYGCQDKIKVISFSFQCQFISAGDQSGRIYVWEISTSTLIFQSKNIEGEILSSQFYSENNLITLHKTEEMGNIIFIAWNIKEQMKIIAIKFKKIFYISQSGKYLAYLQYVQCSIKLLEFYLEQNVLKDKIEKDQINIESRTNTSFAFSPEYKFLLIVDGYDCFLRNIEKRKIYGNLKERKVFAVASLLMINIYCKNYEIVNTTDYFLQKDNSYFLNIFMNNEVVLILTSGGTLINIKKQNFQILKRIYFDDSCIVKIQTVKNNLYLQFPAEIKIYDLEKNDFIDSIEFSGGLFELFPDKSKQILTQDKKFCFSEIDNLNPKNSKLNLIMVISMQLQQVIQNQYFKLIIKFQSLKILPQWQHSAFFLLHYGIFKTPTILKEFFYIPLQSKIKFSLDSLLFTIQLYSHGKIKCIEIQNIQIPESQVNIKEKILGIQQQRKENNSDIFDITQQNENISLTFPKKLHTYTFSKECDNFAFSDINGKIYQYQIEDQKCNLKQIHLQQRQTGPINSLCFSPNGNILLSGGQDGAIRVWNSQKEAQLFCLKYQSDSIKCLSFHPNNMYFAAGYSDGSIGLYITNILKKNLDKESKLIECLGNSDQIGCVKMFAYQSLFSAYQSNFDSRIELEKDDVGFSNLFSQKVGKVEKDIQEIQDSSDIQGIQESSDIQEIQDSSDRQDIQNSSDIQDINYNRPVLRFKQ